jgi:adenylate cyclase
VTTDLSRIADSFVISRQTAFAYKGKPVDVRQIGRDLGVRYVLEGSVRRTGDRVRMNVQLIDAESGAHLWADRFDADLARLAATEEEITGRIARTLSLELAEAAGRRSERERPLNPDVQDLIRRGWAWWYRPRSPESLDQAQQAFERALELDPRSIEAQIGTAAVLSADVLEGFRRGSADDQARAERLLRQVLGREDNHSMAHHALGLLRRTQNRPAEALIEFETAVKLDRNNANAISQIGRVLINMGQPEAAIPYIERAIRLNPYDTILAVYLARLGLCHLLLGGIDLARDFLVRACAANPRLSYTHCYLAGCYGLLGDIEEAKASLTNMTGIRPEATSLTQLLALSPWLQHPAFLNLAEPTLFKGLRLAGFPEE